MLLISATGAWRSGHPGAMIGLLELSGLQNDDPQHCLEEPKRKIEAGLRHRCQGFSRSDFLSLPVMAAYEGYYRRFDKTFHVLLQVESLVLKGKHLPAVSPLVDANFMAEVETFILTAGHDADRLVPPVQIDSSRDGDRFTQMNGTQKIIRVGDMIMRDAQGIACSILYGQDDRSPISAVTRHVLYVAYVPPGIPLEVVQIHLQNIEEIVRLFCPTAILESSQVIQA